MCLCLYLIHMAFDFVLSFQPSLLSMVLSGKKMPVPRVYVTGARSGATGKPALH